MNTFRLLFRSGVTATSLSPRPLRAPPDDSRSDQVPSRSNAPVPAVCPHETLGPRAQFNCSFGWSLNRWGGQHTPPLFAQGIRRGGIIERLCKIYQEQSGKSRHERIFVTTGTAGRNRENFREAPRKPMKMS